LSLAIILSGAEFFTNGIEWLGKRLELGEGAVGSILAAVGTALPETMIPVNSFHFRQGDWRRRSRNRGDTGSAFYAWHPGFIYPWSCGSDISRANKPMRIDRSILMRDLQFFMAAYALAIIASFLRGRLSPGDRHPSRSYAAYAYQTIKTSRGKSDPAADLTSLLFCQEKEKKPGIFRYPGADCGFVINHPGRREIFVGAVQQVLRSGRHPGLGAGFDYYNGCD
jgi:cation:H+ antiporter